MTLAGLYQYEIEDGEEEVINNFINNVIDNAKDIGYSVQEKKRGYEIRNTVMQKEPGELFIHIIYKDNLVELGIPNSIARYGATQCLRGNIEFDKMNEDKIILLKEKYKNDIELKRIHKDFQL